MNTIDILVPVLKRPQNVEPFMKSVQVTRHTFKVYFICSPGDNEQISACRKTDATTFVVDWKPERGDFAKKINWTFSKTQAPWVFQGADDLRFHPSWDVYALRAAERRNAGVVGTNDLGNPLVKRGGHSTHTLIRREYIEKYGGTYDDTGLVFCELYDHQYTDNEFVQTAIRRGEWVFAKRALVEHLHPAWGKADSDSTYEKAIRATREDNRLFLRRMRNGDRAERKKQMAETRAARIALREERRKAKER